MPKPTTDERVRAGRIGFVSLGCPKALVDSERILTQLKVEGYETSNTYADADVVVINTCGFIDSAIEESLDAIGEAMAENGRVIVTGCLGARADLIREHFPDVLSVTGPAAYESVVDAVHQAVPQQPSNPFVDLIPLGGIKLTPRHYAYLKISEGCNHSCSFCIIPSLRGKLRSRRIGEVLDEAQGLVRAGVKELLVISQDTSAYGVDRKYRTDFWDGRPMRTDMVELCKRLGEIAPWVRLHYVYPYPHVDQLLPLMADGLVLPYLDVPLQHGVPRILKLMRRPAATEKTLDRVAAWRAVCPDVAIRSTFIVGFPGETDAEFESLLEFLTDADLDRVGCFAYSDVDGAAANDLPDPIPDDVKQERLERLMSHQAQISERRMAAKIGRTMRVLVDAVDDEGAIGRSSADAPEIDGRVYVDSMNLEPGEFVDVEIVDADTHDLYATVSAG
ncbi:MAG TPA: 30S ribosomal protein S12 methylthiotransferase RimO [Pseudomonadales bacterium]|nr:30S ribosomal protein S12 methylthiotransferase RimO [Pseudomonadales bacterium]